MIVAVFKCVILLKFNFSSDASVMMYVLDISIKIIEMELGNVPSLLTVQLKFLKVLMVLLPTEKVRAIFFSC